MEIKTFENLNNLIITNLAGDLKINYEANINKNFIIVVEMMFGFFQYHMSYQKNTRGQGYYFYEDWIYTEKEIVQMIYNDISKFI